MKKILIQIILILLFIITIMYIFMRKDNSDIRNEQNVSNSDMITEEGEMSFVMTYRVVEKLDYKDTADEYAYVVIDTFQHHTPYIFKVNKEMADTLNENSFYEITFKGKEIKNFDYNTAEVLAKFDVVDIKVTTKSGLDQIQRLRIDN